MALVVRDLVKSYGSVRVLDGVDLSVNPGEIHALLGPNGSGKSTLIRCLSGATVQDSGSIEINGVALRQQTPQDSIAAGVAVIYQHFSLIPSLTVADNVFLGDEHRRALWIDHAAQAAETTRLLDQFGRPIRPKALVGQLSVGDRQLVEIAKALHRKPDVLTLDEPTAALGEQEATYLGEQLKVLRNEGLAILYVTHLLSEVFAIADRVTVLRDGQVVLSAAVSELDPSLVIAAISPSASRRDAYESNRVDGGDVVLDVSDLVVERVGPVRFDVRRGEVVAIFGLLGSGRTEILEGIFGVRPVTAGGLVVEGKPYRPRDPARALRSGIALIAGDRRHQSIFDKLSAIENLLEPHFSRLARWIVRRPAVERRAFDDVAGRLSLHPHAPRALAWTFSGGNQQKLAVGRWLAAAETVDLFMLDEPTQGIDVGARADLYALLRQLADDDGKGVLFTSSDPEETVTLADRVLVLRRGRIVASLTREECTEHTILALAHGAHGMDGAKADPTGILQPESDNDEP